MGLFNYHHPDAAIPISSTTHICLSDCRTAIMQHFRGIVWEVLQHIYADDGITCNKFDEP